MSVDTAIREARNDGLTVPQIAASLGLPVDYVYDAIVRMWMEQGV